MKALPPWPRCAVLASEGLGALDLQSAQASLNAILQLAWAQDAADHAGPKDNTPMTAYIPGSSEDPAQIVRELALATAEAREALEAGDPDRCAASTARLRSAQATVRDGAQAIRERVRLRREGAIGA
jgi:hypothetical protein